MHLVIGSAKALYEIGSFSYGYVQTLVLCATQWCFEVMFM